MKKITVYLKLEAETKSCLRYTEVENSDGRVAVPREEQTLGDVYLHKSALPDGDRPDRVKVRLYVG